MNFSFIVCAGPVRHQSQIHKIVDPIIIQNIPNYEILWVGDKPSCADVFPNVRFIDFPTVTEKAHITRKKNIGTQEAQYENIVYLHDYITLDCENWYHGWKDFNDEFEVAINPVLINESASHDDAFTYRHADWLVDPKLLWKIYPHLHWKFWDVSLPYNYRGLERIQYISGGYWVAKRQFMLDNPLNEDLYWGDAEDVEFSERIREKITFKLNPNSYVWVNKPGKWKPGIIPQEYLDALIKEYNLTLTKDMRVWWAE